MNDFTGRFSDARDALTYLLAGKAFITVRSTKTQKRYTFKIKRVKDGIDRWFVSYLTGTNNENDYAYVGVMDGNPLDFRLTGKSKLTKDADPVRAFDFMLGLLKRGKIHEKMEIWHEGKCGRCGRKLTVPESVKRGLGPECSLRPVTRETLRCEAA